MVAADSKAKLLNDAERYVLHGKIQQAITEYLKIIELDPNDVLILNTIGDLYLRLSNSQEANKCFIQVAENYVHNNFFLKAIAVYKKILSADPNNLEINMTMASLYAKQGLSLDARNQYMKVAGLLEKEGKSKETVSIYEKVAELDPSNSGIQRKLAELYLMDGAKDKAHAYLTGAARAQVRAGDLQGASDSYERAMKLAPLDVEAMRGFLECGLKMGNPRPVLDQLQKSVEMAPDNLDLREMLGRAYLERGDSESATKAFQVVVSLDESRYENFFAVAQSLIDRNAYDEAVDLLDKIIPILITHRATDRAAKLYELILQHDARHIPTLKRLASLCSATGNMPRYLEILDEIADYYLGINSPAEALEYLEKIIKANPESDKHRKLHQQAFTETYPDTPYVPPVEPEEPLAEPEPILAQRDMTAANDGNASAIVEVDLLLNYGLREKAQSILQSLEARDPYDKEVRTRLLTLYKAEKKYTEAAEQCLLLAVLQRRAKNENSTQSYLAEAKQLAPDLAEYETDLDAFARRNGIAAEIPGTVPPSTGALKSDEEVDLSSDLLDIFYTNDPESASAGDSEQQGIREALAETYPQEMPSQPPSKSVQEQLQEVDFYIRLGFNEEARTKLSEIARLSPDNPEVASRYQKLAETEQAAAPGISGQSEDLVEINQPADEADFSLGIDDAQDRATESGFLPIHAERKPLRPAETPFVQASPQRHDPGVNEMFADLLAEVSSGDEAVARASFEEHFSLGTAYREMELVEEAIKEFQIALKTIDLHKRDPRVIQCCGMLSTCFLKKNMPRSALRWCQTGLSVADNSSHEAMALRYDMGVAHSIAGSSERALECFDKIFSIDPSYRDVAQRIDELRGAFERHASSP